MARKSLKRELSNKLSETQHYAPVSSGDTILIDSDVTMVDEGYETNHQHKAFSESINSQNNSGSDN